MIKLDSQDQYIQNILDCNLFGVSAANMDGALIFANNALLKLFKTNSDHFVGRHASEFYAEPDIRDQIIRDLNNDGFIEKIDVKLKRDDGTFFFASLSFKKSIYAGENAYFCWFYDLTERIKMEKSLAEQMKINLHHSKLASIGELASGVAHEINNPLAIINLYNNRLAKTLEFDKKIEKEFLIDFNLKVKSAIKRVTQIIRGIKNFSRQDEEDLEKVNLNLIINDLVELIKPISEDQGVSISIHSSSDDLFVLSNIGQIQQVMLNLINNACYALKHAKQKKIKITLEKVGSEIIILTSDTGEGISDDDLDKIFDPFFTTKPINEGTGIGLSMSYNIIKNFNGELLARNNKDQGATFEIRLPSIESR